MIIFSMNVLRTIHRDKLIEPSRVMILQTIDELYPQRNAYFWNWKYWKIEKIEN